VLPGGLVSALLRETANRVKEMALSKTLVEKLSAQMLFQMGNSPSPAEKRSWENSLVEICEILILCGLGEVNLLIEYQLPYSSKRIDVIAIGSNPKNESPTIIVIELKQWTNASLIEGALDSLKIDSYGNTPILHPVVQVSRYCEYLNDFNRYVSDENTNLFGIAYLHNWIDTNNTALDLIQPTANGMLFTANQKNKLKEFLTARISSNFSDQITDDFLNSKVAPTKQLMQLAAEEVKNREQFRLLDEQQIAYSMVMKALRDAETSNTKTAVIITGGPGTGKSVIALSLLGELSRRGKTTLHATGSKAFRNSLRKVAGARSPQVQKLFSYFNSFMTAERNSLDVIICDEAHRIRETSANRYTKADLRTGTPQLHELLNVARVPVFLLDSNQVVRKGETGTPEYIENEARSLGLKVIRVDLDGQFRCGGSRLYETWLNGFLNLEDATAINWSSDPNFSVLVADSPSEIVEKLRAFESEGFKSRITAGYCWTWNDPNDDGTLPNDVKIGNWSRPWNVKGDRGVGEYMSGELWAIDPKGFDQIGCVYTAQGFEYDWNAVIFGPDLVWRSGKWIGDRSGSKDPAMRGIAPEHFETLVKNTYKVLLTRGLVGTILFSVDEETQAHFKKLFS
jgi:hypothetical protein